MHQYRTCTLAANAKHLYFVHKSRLPTPPPFPHPALPSGCRRVLLPSLVHSRARERRKQKTFKAAAGAGVSGTEDGPHFLCHLF